MGSRPHTAPGHRAALAGLPVFVAIAGLAFALPVSGLDAQGLWRDEVDAIRFAASPLTDGLRTFLTPGQNGPLYFLLLRPWLAVAGNTGVALRFFSLFFGVLAVALTARLARELLPGRRWPALAAALLAATSPYLVWYSQEGKMYTLVVALVLGSMSFYLAALRRGGWPLWLGYVATTTAAFYVHLIAALIIPAQALIFAVGPWPRRRRLKPWLLSLAILVLPYLPLLTWQIPALVQKVDTGYSFYSLDKMFVSLLADYSLGVVPAVGRWAAVLLGALALAAFLGLLPRRGRRPWAAIAILLAWLLVPILGLYLITLRRPMFTTRYLIFILPAFWLLLTGGMVAVSRWWRPAAGVLLAVVVVLNGWNTWSQARTPIKADYRGATYYLLDRLAPGDLLLFQIPYGRYSFDYYLEQYSARHPGRPVPRASTAAEGSYRWAEGLYTNSGMAPEEVDRRMAGLTAGSQTVWLVESEASMWDSRALVHSWLDGHAALAEQAGFTRVSVYRYILPSP